MKHHTQQVKPYQRIVQRQVALDPYLGIVEFDDGHLGFRDGSDVTDFGHAVEQFCQLPDGRSFLQELKITQMSTVDQAAA